MAVLILDDRDQLDRAAANLAGMYAQAELDLQRMLALQVKAGLAQDPDAVLKHLRLAELRDATRQIVERLATATPAEVEAILAAAAAGGAATALHELAALAGVPNLGVTSAVPGSFAAQSLVLDLTNSFDDVTRRILRWPDDVYRQAVAGPTSRLLLGLGETNRSAQAKAWQQLIAGGTRGFVDKAGRRWKTSSYVEMATRTAARRAWGAQHEQTMLDHGMDLVSVVVGSDACQKCAQWAGKVLRLTPGPVGRVKVARADGPGDVTVEIAGTLDHARDTGWQHPNCFPGWVPVSAPTGIAASDARWYEGELVVIHTAGGRELAVTPNHPVLTPGGWVAAGVLGEGDHLIRYDGPVERVPAGEPDHEGGEAPIGEVHKALRQARGVTSVLVPGAAEQFHGDGTFDAEVDVVLADRLLRHDGQPASLEQTAEGEFLLSGVRLPSLLGPSPALQVLEGALAAPDRVVRGGGDPEPFGRVSVGHSDEHCFGSATRRDALLEQVTADHAAGDPEPGGDRLLGLASQVGGGDPSGVEVFPASLRQARETDVAQDRVDGDAMTARELLDGLAGLVALEQVVEVERRRQWSGHVYNLQTGGGWYLADSLVVHNCRCTQVAYLPGLSVVADATTYDPELEAQRERLRALEREVRKAKTELAAAVTGEQRREATRRVRELQAEIRDHVDDTGLNRKAYREQLNLGARFRTDGPAITGPGGAAAARGRVMVPQAPGFAVRDHELATAERLAAGGRRVEFLVPANQPGIRTPDILLDGQQWEMKSPTGDSKNTISNQLRRASGQAERLVLDTTRTSLDDDEVVAEVRRRLSTPDARLAEVMVLRKDGSVVMVVRETPSP